MKNSIDTTNKIFFKSFLILISFFLINSSLHGQWIQQDLPPGDGLILSVDFLNTQKGISGGWYFESSNNISGKSFYTVDGGVHWLPSVIPDSVRAITNIKYISDNTAYAVGAYNLSNVSGRTSGAVNIMKLAKNNRASLGVSFSPGYSAVILKTTDGGSSWFTFGNVPDDYNYLYQLEFIDPANFLMIGTHQTYNNFTGKLGTSNDGGNNWRNVSIPLNEGDLNCLQYAGGKIFAAGYEETSIPGTRAIILKSDDNGATWTKKIYPSEENFNDIKFTDNTIGYACSYYYTNSRIPVSKIYRTTDGGSSWNPLNMDLDSVMINKIGVCKQTGVVTAFGNRYGDEIGGISNNKCFILSSSDFGENWVSQKSINNGNVFLRDMVFLDSDNAYTVGFLGTDPHVYHTTNGGYDYFNNPSSLVPDDFQLFQNYPNPFNPVTQIKFQLNIDEFVSLKIFNSLGEETGTLLEGRQNAGLHTVVFNGGDTPSGIYFYTLKAGNYSQTLKMILLR
ncbi:MAG: T9SS type A sorting domain-containing protein [Ignavibacteria bacterium]|nr:T9SS type A sorting domain-containing protein [Ignavibacteria bacterium]